VKIVRRSGRYRDLKNNKIIIIKKIKKNKIKIIIIIIIIIKDLSYISQVLLATLEVARVNMYR